MQASLVEEQWEEGKGIRGRANGISPPCLRTRSIFSSQDTVEEMVMRIRNKLNNSLSVMKCNVLSTQSLKTKQNSISEKNKMTVDYIEIWAYIFNYSLL